MRKFLLSRWKKEYLSTASKVILAETLSPTFVGMTFAEVAEICYVKLNLVLIAVEARKYEGGKIWINPRNKKITPNIIGLFLTGSSDAAKRAWFYCRVCHENLENLEDLKRCSCKKLAKARFEYYADGKANNGNQNKNSLHNLQFTPQPKISSEVALRNRKGKLESVDEGDRQETAKVNFLLYDMKLILDMAFIDEV